MDRNHFSKLGKLTKELKEYDTYDTVPGNTSPYQHYTLCYGINEQVKEADYPLTLTPENDKNVSRPSVVIAVATPEFSW
jgi:hypothetical protein